MRRKICVVLPSHWSGSNGGAELQANYLVDALVAEGRYDVTYVARRIAPGFSPAGYGIVQVGRGGSPSLLSDAPSLYRALVSLQPHIIYQRVGGTYTGVCAAYAKRHRCRMVWHVASDDDVAASPRLPSITRLRPYLERWLLRFGIRHASAIVTQTRKQAHMLERNHRRSASAIVPNFHPPFVTRSPAKATRITVAWVANFKPAKRPEVFIRLAQRMRESPVRFVMAGRAGAYGETRAMKEAIAESRNLDYVGELSQEEVHHLLESSQLFVNTSRVEGFPNTFIQAWMRRAAVVSLSVDPDEVLTREGVGVLAGSEERLWEAVAALVNGSDYREALVDRAQRYALSMHGLENTRRVVDVLDPPGDGGRCAPLRTCAVNIGRD